MSPHSPRHPKGVTLIELSVVIAMILSLTSGLFFSASYYRDSANKANCIVQLDGIQKAARSYQYLNNKQAGDAITKDELVGENKAIPAELFCPQSNGSYIFQDTVPAKGLPFAICEDYDTLSGSVDATLRHREPDTSNW